MKLKATISGSFQKFLREIKQIIDEFEKNEIEILSPKLSNVKSNENNFIIFEHENKLPKNLEISHLKAIERSDFLYIVNPQGYIGNSCAMEIGFALAHNIPIFTLEIPNEFIFSLFTQTQKSISEIKTNIQKIQNEMSQFFESRFTLFMLQKYVKEFVYEKGFEKETIKDVLLLFIGEVLELMKSIQKITDIKTKIEKDKFKDIEEEFSDCLIYLLDLANLSNINLEKTFLNKMKLNEETEWTALGEIRNKINHQFNILDLDDKTATDEIFAISNLSNLIPQIFSFEPTIIYLLEILKKLEKLYLRSTNEEFRFQILNIFSIRWWKEYETCIKTIMRFFDEHLSPDLATFQILSEQTDNIKYQIILLIYQQAHPEKIRQLIWNMIKNWSDYAFDKYYKQINYSLIKIQAHEFDLELVEKRNQVVSEKQYRIDKIRRQIAVYI